MTHTASSFFKHAMTLFVAVMISLSAHAQQVSYTGTWVTNREIKVPDEHTSGVVTIGANSTTWNIFNNQLFFDFSNKIKNDTLLLLYRSCDCSKPYKNSTIKFPKQNAVFAKCYRVSETELGVLYTNKAFITSFKKYAVGTRAEKDMIFPAVLYLNNNKPIKTAHPLKTE